jgi:acetyl esterase
MALDAQAQAFLDEAAAAGGPAPWDVPTWQFRAGFDEFLGAINIPRQPVPRIESLGIPGPHGAIPLRVYWPKAPETGGGSGEPLPMLLHFHGSGFVVGGLNSHDALCRTLCRQAECIVVAVDYRKAPEHKFPAGIDDCWAATEWAVAHAGRLGGDRDRVAVFGDSTGGNNAAVVAQRAKAAGGPPLALQVLVYPPLDMAADTPSYETYAEGYNLTALAMRWFIDQYLGGEADKADPDASPLRADDLAGLAPAYVLTVGHDPLRDEELAYIERLRAARVAVEHRDYADLFHGFWFMGARLDAAPHAHAEVAVALRQAFGTA